MNKYNKLKIFIIFIVFLLIVLYYFFPYFFLNLIGLFNSTKNKYPLDVVIAHYKEDLSWVDTDLPKNCRIFIYTKSKEKPNCKRKYIHKYLPNTGRIDNTILYHIIKNYDKPMNENIIFLPGSCNLLYKKINLYLLMHNIGKYKFNNCSITPNNIIFRNKYLYELDNNFKYHCPSNKNNKNNNCKIIYYKFKKFDQFKKYFNLKLDYYSFWCMNLIKSNLIYNRQKDFYIKLYNVINSDDNMKNGFFIEISWYGILNNK